MDFYAYLDEDPDYDLETVPVVESSSCCSIKT